MAPRKPTVTAETSKKKPVKKTNRVVKRPARGYSKYKNGFLNVTPTSKEMEIVKSNQKSPLLRLPPEIRNKIWEYSLGHNIFKPIRFRHRWISRRDEPQIGLALLATCRQIYSEAAFMPLNLNTFAANVVIGFNSNTFAANIVIGDGDSTNSFDMFKVHQRRQITSIRLAYHNYGVLDYWDAFQLDKCRTGLEELLPNLSKIEFVIILAGLAEFREDIVAQTEAVLRQGDSTNKPTNVTVKVLDANSTLARWDI